MTGNQIEVAASADSQLLRTKLKNLISRIRYTNIAPDEFTKAVVPAGLLSAEEAVSVFSYFCGDEATRRDLKIKFNTTPRKKDNREIVTDYQGFYSACLPLLGREEAYPAFSNHSMSFKAEQTQVAENVGSDYLAKKTVVSRITFVWPKVNSEFRGNHVVLIFNVSIREYSGPAKEGNFILKFEKYLLSCKHGGLQDVSVEPPLELVSGRRYSVMIEDHSTSDVPHIFGNHPEAYIGRSFEKTTREANLGFQDICFTLNDIQWNTDFHNCKKFPSSSQVFDMIRGIEIGLV